MSESFQPLRDSTSRMVSHSSGHIVGLQHSSLNASTHQLAANTLHNASMPRQESSKIHCISCLCIVIYFEQFSLSRSIPCIWSELLQISGYLCVYILLNPFKILGLFSVPPPPTTNFFGNLVQIV